MELGKTLRYVGTIGNGRRLGWLVNKKGKAKGPAVLLALVVSFQHPALLGLMGFR